MTQIRQWWVGLAVGAAIAVSPAMADNEDSKEADRAQVNTDTAIANVHARLDALEAKTKERHVKISGYSQFMWVSDPSLAGKEPFIVKRMRFGFSGQLNAWAHFKVQPDFAGLSATGGNVGLREGWVDLIAEKDLATFRVGQYHQPFGFENQYSSSRKKVSDTPFYMASVLTADYDYGVFWWGNLPGDMKEWLQWRVGVMNGSGNTTTENNTTKDFAGRVTTNALGKEVELGASVYARSAGATEVSATHIGAHVKVEMTAPCPWYFTGEYVGGKDSAGTNEVMNAIATLEVKPFGGKSVLSELAPVVRYELWDANTSVAGGHFTNWTVGLNWYPDKPIRFLVDYVMKQNPTNTATNRLNVMIQINY